MTQAELTIVRDEKFEVILRVSFSETNFDTFMFKNNVFNWLFTNALEDFELGEDTKNIFLVKLSNRKDKNSLFRAFPTISFDELDIRPKEYIEKMKQKDSTYV